MSNRAHTRFTLALVVYQMVQEPNVIRRIAIKSRVARIQDKRQEVSGIPLAVERFLES